METVRAHLVEITANAPETVASYVALARATLDRVVTDGRVLPIRAAKMRQIMDAAESSAHAAASTVRPITRLR